MPEQNEAFLKRLLATFRLEMQEHLQAMAGGLIELEQTPAGAQGADILQRIFREAHSLKGAARAVNQGEIEAVCHAMESLFAEWQRGQLRTTPALFDLLHQALDALGAFPAGDPDEADTPEAAASRARIVSLPKRLDEARHGLPHSAGPPPEQAPAAPPAEPLTMADPPPVAPSSADTLRIAATKLDAVMRQAEELLAPRLAAAERARSLRRLATALSEWQRRRHALQPSLRRMERICERSGESMDAAQRKAWMQLAAYLDEEMVAMKSLEGQLAGIVRQAEHDQRAWQGLTDALLREVREMHLLPFSTLLESLPRMARLLARDQGKDAVLTIRGAEIEIDRRILEAMKDPLTHLLRNCIDHGIEPPGRRRALGKPEAGTIVLSVSQKDSGKVELCVSDDGAGIDLEQVREAACRQGVVSREEAGRLDNAATLALVFRSGLSTSPIVTDISGRGLGLAILREKVEHLGGGISLETRPAAGTDFRISLPLTLATFRAVLVRCAEWRYAVPALGVERVTRVSAPDIRTVGNRETLPLDGQSAALVPLGDILGLPRAATPPGDAADKIQVLVLGSGMERIAFRVDEILGEQEVLVKPLGPQLERVRNVAGASVLGTGEVVPVLNVTDLMQSAARHAAAPEASAPVRPAEARQPSILVVEDSITSRSLLKNILEAAGYRVATAVDGIDGYTALKTGRFDLLVSDVEMPRMDGFDLTAKVRADKHLAELPIVLVTALGSREQRERGIDVGANAYIVKSGFDQGNLLETLRRLL